MQLAIGLAGAAALVFVFLVLFRDNDLAYVLALVGGRGLATVFTWLRQPDLAAQLSYDSESGMFVALGPRAALLAVARLIQAAIADPLLLRTAVERADPDALE